MNPLNNQELDKNPKRKRGGQLGNTNAFKHGFYSELFKQAERESLSKIQNTDLSNEVELIRVQLSRYLEAESNLTHLDYETRLQALRAVSLAVECLNRMIRTQAILNSNLPIPPETESTENALS